jgi:hypothetical protein
MSTFAVSIAVWAGGDGASGPSGQAQRIERRSRAQPRGLLPSLRPLFAWRCCSLLTMSSNENGQDACRSAGRRRCARGHRRARRSRTLGYSRIRTGFAEMSIGEGMTRAGFQVLLESYRHPLGSKLDAEVDEPRLPGGGRRILAGRHSELSHAPRHRRPIRYTCAPDCSRFGVCRRNASRYPLRRRVGKHCASSATVQMSDKLGCA